MTRTRVYLIIQAALCVLLVVMLSVSAVSIYREGAARKAEHPLEPIYTREIAAERFAPIAPVCFIAIGLAIAGLVLGARDVGAEKPVRDAERARDLTVTRVIKPTDAMCGARKKQARLQWIGRGAFAACMVPLVIYMLNPAHFPLEDLEGMFLGLIKVFLPWTAAGIGALAVTSVLRERYVLQETEAARAQIRAEKEAGLAPGPAPAPRAGNVGMIQIVLIVAAILLIVAGVFNGSARDVLYKAINICTECVGLG